MEYYRDITGEFLTEEEYREKLDTDDALVRKRLDTMYKRVGVWANHVGLELNEVEEGVEVKFPYNYLLHVDPFEVYIAGSSEEDGDKIVREGFEINKIGEYHDGPIQAKPLRKAFTTLDKNRGTLDIGEHMYDDCIKVTLWQTESDFKKNWSDMSPHERKEKIDMLAEGHHKDLLVEQLESAGLGIPD